MWQQVLLHHLPQIPIKPLYGHKTGLYFSQLSSAWLQYKQIQTVVKVAMETISFGCHSKW